MSSSTIVIVIAVAAVSCVAHMGILIRHRRRLHREAPRTRNEIVMLCILILAANDEGWGLPYYLVDHADRILAAKESEFHQ